MSPDGERAHLPIDPDLAPDDPAQPAPGHLAHRSRRSTPPEILVAIAAGGVLGASARYGVSRWAPTPRDGFPWATFWTNLGGSLLLGLLMVHLAAHPPPARWVRASLTSGVLGAFTTMAALQVDTALLLDHGHPVTATLYLAGSLAAGVAAAVAGIRLGRWLTPPPGGST